MPGGRRKKLESFADELVAIDAQIEEYTAKVRELKDRKKALAKEEQKNKNATKWEELKNSGVDVDKLLDFAKKQD